METWEHNRYAIDPQSAEIGRRECAVGTIVGAVVGVRSCLVLNEHSTERSMIVRMIESSRKNSVGYCYRHGIGVEKNELKDIRMDRAR
ncbi:hypothetical protein C2G38_2215787 [Gigaspora rosea]|uniref:Uncharacterized protein n=1 Tax=Gigaspora rosea TaxID=44941 RepID=A0A397U9F7_9GLOM|nr:hypothetical protein C2G38_2215787 [Gigaspora rosea]